MTYKRLFSLSFSLLRRHSQNFLLIYQRLTFLFLESF